MPPDTTSRNKLALTQVGGSRSTAPGLASEAGVWAAVSILGRLDSLAGGRNIFPGKSVWEIKTKISPGNHYGRWAKIDCRTCARQNLWTRPKIVCEAETPRAPHSRPLVGRGTLGPMEIGPPLGTPGRPAASRP